LPTEVSDRPAINSLQAGRAFAALAVVLIHSVVATDAFTGGVPHAVSVILRQGYLGVDFFFVLSGFIIHWSSAGKTPREYALHRLRRIYVPYLPIGIGMALLYSVYPRPVPWQWLTTLTLFPIEPGPALRVAWTLQHEVTFYAVYGILFFAGWLRWGLAAWALAITAFCLSGVDAGMPLRPVNLEFVFGILAAELVQRQKAPLWLAPIGLLPAALWILLGGDKSHSVLIGLAFGFLIAPLAAADIRGRIRTPALLTFLGAASYSIYLMHNPLISVFARVTRGAHWSIALILITAAATLAGCLYHVLVEKPALRLGRERPSIGIGQPNNAG